MQSIFFCTRLKRSHVGGCIWFYCHPPFVGDRGAKATQDLLLVLLNQNAILNGFVEGSPDPGVIAYF